MQIQDSTTDMFMQLPKHELRGILWKIVASPLAAAKLLSSSHHEK